MFLLFDFIDMHVVAVATVAIRDRDDTCTVCRVINCLVITSYCIARPTFLLSGIAIVSMLIMAIPYM